MYYSFKIKNIDNSNTMDLDLKKLIISNPSYVHWNK